MVGNVGSYDGPLFRLVRPSDRATCDVFERSAALVYFTNGVAQAFSTWLSGVNPKVQIWYDQTMGGFDATQTDYAAMPTLNWSERWLDFRTSCFLRLPNGTLPTGNAPFSFGWDGVCYIESSRCHHAARPGGHTLPGRLSVVRADTHASYVHPYRSCAQPPVHPVTSTTISTSGMPPEIVCI